MIKRTTSVGYSSKTRSEPIIHPVNVTGRTMKRACLCTQCINEKRKMQHENLPPLKMKNFGQVRNHHKKRLTYPSSFWTLESGFTEIGGPEGVWVVVLGTTPPPPPRRGFAILPAKLRGEGVAAFCAKKNVYKSCNKAETNRIPLA